MWDQSLSSSFTSGAFLATAPELVLLCTSGLPDFTKVEGSVTGPWSGSQQATKVQGYWGPCPQTSLAQPHAFSCQETLWGLGFFPEPQRFATRDLEDFSFIFGV